MRQMFLLLIFLCGCVSKIDYSPGLKEQLKTKTKVEEKSDAFKKGNTGQHKGRPGSGATPSSGQFHF